MRVKAEARPHTHSEVNTSRKCAHSRPVHNWVIRVTVAWHDAVCSHTHTHTHTCLRPVSGRHKTINGTSLARHAVRAMCVEGWDTDNTLISNISKKRARTWQCTSPVALRNMNEAATQPHAKVLHTCKTESPCKSTTVWSGKSELCPIVCHKGTIRVKTRVNMCDIVSVVVNVRVSVRVMNAWWPCANRPMDGCKECDTEIYNP